jgi:phage shock protein C
MIGDLPQPEGATPGERRHMDPTRKLYRSKSNRQLAGVCGGLAQYFNIDPTLVRVLFILLAVLGGSGLVLYLAMWIIVPKEP